MSTTISTLHDELQVSIAESWSSEDRDWRKIHAMKASKLAGELYKSKTTCTNSDEESS